MVYFAEIKHEYMDCHCPLSLSWPCICLLLISSCLVPSGDSCNPSCVPPGHLHFSDPSASPLFLLWILSAHVSLFSTARPFSSWALIFLLCGLPSCSDCSITHFNGGIFGQIFGYNLAIFFLILFSCWKVLVLFFFYRFLRVLLVWILCHCSFMTQG